MPALALAILQRERGIDPAPALATLPGARGYVLRDPELGAAAGPPRAEVLEGVWTNRAEAAALVARVARADLIVVLEADERVSPELAAALASCEAPGGPAEFAARRTLRFLGRDIDVGMVVMAWRGAPTRAAAPVTLAGSVTEIGRDVATTIARLDAAATLAAAGRATSGVADFVTRPAAALLRRFRQRWRDGVPGLVLSILETYAEVLIAAKVWEREHAAAPRHARVSARAVPPGFVPIETRRGWAIVRVGADARFLRALLDATPESVEGEPLAHGGRGVTWALALGDGARAVLRWYRRGGALRHLIRDRYFGWRPRPIVELTLTEEARRRGVAAVEVLAARVDRLAGGFYRGAIATREVEHAATLAERLRQRPPAAERAAIVVAVARAVRIMHDRGVHHRDLNAANILLRSDGDRVEVHLIDFDRAQLRARLSQRLRRRALRRLARSVDKLDADTAPTQAERAAFHRAYREGA